MAETGGQPGNQNARKAKRWCDAINRALAKIDLGNGVNGGLDICAAQLVRAAVNGEQWALRELGDRVDGKPSQQLVLNGNEDGGAIVIQAVSTDVAL